MYIEKSRPVERQLVVPSTRTGRRRSTSGTGRDDIAQVRAWAEAQGIEVSPRGRIKKETLDRYDAEHSKAKPTGAKPAPAPAVTTPPIRVTELTAWREK